MLDMLLKSCKYEGELLATDDPVWKTLLVIGPSIYDLVKICLHYQSLFLQAFPANRSQVEYSPIAGVIARTSRDHLRYVYGHLGKRSCI